MLVTPQEIIEQTNEGFETEITIAHLHARDKQEVPMWILKSTGKYLKGYVNIALV